MLAELILCTFWPVTFSLTFCYSRALRAHIREPYCGVCIKSGEQVDPITQILLHTLADTIIFRSNPELTVVRARVRHEMACRPHHDDPVGTVNFLTADRFIL